MKLKVIEACKNDIHNVFNLSNDPIVRKNSLNSKIIDWNDHIIWFENKLKKSDSVLYVVKTEKNDFVGNVKFEKKDNSFVIGIQIKAEFRGKGLGSVIIQQATQKFITENKINEVIAYIKVENIASYKIFLKSNYVLQPTIKINDFDCFKMIYKK